MRVILLIWLAAVAIPCSIVLAPSVTAAVTVAEAAQFITQQTDRSFLFAQNIGARQLSSWNSLTESENGPNQFEASLRIEGLTLVLDVPGPELIVPFRLLDAFQAALASPRFREATAVSSTVTSLTFSQLGESNGFYNSQV